MTALNSTYIEIGLNLIEGCRVPAYRFRFLDANGNDLENFTPTAVFAKIKGGTAIKTLTDGSGLKLDGAVAELDYTNDLPARTYWFYMDVKLNANNWTFPGVAGMVTVSKKGAATGGSTPVEEIEIVLPVVPDGIEPPPGSGIGYMMIGSTFQIA